MRTAYLRSSFSQKTRRHFDAIAIDHPRRRKQMRYYIHHTTKFLRAAIPPQKKCLLIGVLSHEFLEALEPSLGVGLDISPEWVELANRPNPHPNISYHCVLPENFETKEKFDYVILLNVADHAEDLLLLVGSLNRFVHPDSTIILSFLNPLWHNLTRLASRLRIRIPDTERNLVASQMVSTALEVKRFRVTHICRRVLFPKWVPILSWFFNQFLVRLPLLRRLAFIQYVFAKPLPLSDANRKSCSVIVPCYNEEGNIAECIERIPRMGSFTEIVVVNDGSEDRTLPIVQKICRTRRNVTLVTYGNNRGKGAAVLEGMKRSKGDILMILDADMTVPPEELSEFYEAIECQAADFVSGTRFIYPMERQAMRLTNYLGNIVFSKLIEWIAGTDCSDTLCGTKAMRREDFEDFRPEDTSWGDFDLIFHAARRKLKCIQIPVHYKSRVNGVSKMKAFKSGITFLKLCVRKWAEIP